MGNVLPSVHKNEQNEEEGARELGIKNHLKQTEVNTLIEYYKQNDPNNHGLLPQQFREVAGDFIAKELTIDPAFIFSIFDKGEQGVIGRVTLKEFILGYAILCRGSTQGRLRYLFSIYRAEESEGFLTRDQLISALTLIKRIFTQLSDSCDETEAEDEKRIVEVANELLDDSSDTLQAKDKTISYDDFIEKLEESEDVTSWLDKLSDVAGEHLKFIEQKERDMVDLNMEREGILHSNSQAATPTDTTWPRPQRRSDRPSTEIHPPADKKRRIPLPKKQKLVRRDLQKKVLPLDSADGASPQDNTDQESVNPAEPFIINYDQIKFGRVLGRGACATVYECEWLHVPVAVKVFRDGRGNAAGEDRLSTYDERIRRAAVGDYVEEFWLLLQIRHPHCLLYMGICFEPVVCIVTELFSGGSVSNFLHGPNPRKFSPEQALEMLSGVARAMYYLHASTPSILHRDLKASNILINRTITHCVICDFGLSKQFVDEASGMQNTIDTSCSSETEAQTAGTPYTMAPEIMEAKPYTPAADVYSYGIVMYEMYTGRVPFGPLKPIQLMFQVTQGYRPLLKEEDDIPPTMRSLIERCWAQDQHQRPTFNDILEVLTSEALKNEIDVRQTEFNKRVETQNHANTIDNKDELSKKLLEAAYRGQDDMLASLIANGADVNYSDYDERTALHVAAAEGRIECIRLLINAKASLTLDRWSHSPLVDALNYEKRTNDSEPIRLLREFERCDNSSVANGGVTKTTS